MKKPNNKVLIISIITGLLYVSLLTYACVLTNKGYIDTATGVYISDSSSLTILDILLMTLMGPCLMICMFSGIVSIANDFKAKEIKRAIITIIGLILLVVYNIGANETIYELPKDAKEKTEKCEKSIECYKANDIAICMYGKEEVKCPIDMVKEKIKD